MSGSGFQRSSKPRDRIVNTAKRLFYRDGIHVGIDRILTEADVAPMTLYRQFSGKDELVAEALEQWSALWLGRLHERVQYGDNADARLEGLLDALEEWFGVKDFRGSFVTNAEAELRGNPDHPAQKVITVHRLAMRNLLADLAKRAGALDPAPLTDQLQVLIEGIIAVAVIDRRTTVAVAVRALAHAVLAAK